PARPGTESKLNVVQNHHRGTPEILRSNIASWCAYAGTVKKAAMIVAVNSGALSRRFSMAEHSRDEKFRIADNSGLLGQNSGAPADSGVPRSGGAVRSKQSIP